MNIESLKWQFNRFTSMDIREVLYRIKTKWEVKNLRSSNILKLLVKEDCKIDYFLNINEFDLDINLLNELPAGNCFELYGVNIPLENLEWNKDYVEGYIYPDSHISKIKLHNYGNREVKNILEIHRLHFLVDFALRYHITKEPEIFELIIDVIKSWLKDNPYAHGMGWVSPTIVAKRLISLIFVWNILDLNSNQELKDLRELLFESFEAHITVISKTLSLYSSANNHLTAEMLGVFTVLKSCENVLSRAGFDLLDETYGRLEKLIIEQNYSDGKNKESGFGYQYQVTDWFYLAYLVDDRINEANFSKVYKIQLHNMFKFFRACFDNNGNYFDYGDRDNFHVLPFKFRSSRYAFIQLLESGANSFNDASLVLTGLAEQKDAYNFRNKILFGKNYKVEKRCKNWNQSKYYKDSGHIVSQFTDSKGNSIYFHFRSGGFGYLSIAAHSHSDLNSFYLSVNGQPVFVDVGTYCYRKDPKYRNYFRSAQAHNTVSLNNQNHVVAYGFNHWHNKKNLGAKVIDYRDSDETLMLTSKCCFPDHATHIRKVILDKSNFKLEIIDEIEASGNVEGQMFLHLSPELNFKKNAVELNDGKSIFVESKSPFSIKRGEEKELSGWYSPEFSEKLPTQTLCAGFNYTNKLTIKIEE